MPATSKKIRRAAAIAKHSPKKLFARNKGLLKMTDAQLHDFAATKEKGLLERKRKRSPMEKERAKVARKRRGL